MIFRKTMLALMIMGLLLSGCGGGGGNGDGSGVAVVTVKASPNPVTTGVPYTHEDGTPGLQWTVTLTLTETNGVGVTLSTYDYELRGDSGFTRSATGEPLGSFTSIPANDSLSGNWKIAAYPASTEQQFSTATVKFTLYGTDDNGNSVECSVEIVVYWQT